MTTRDDDDSLGTRGQNAYRLILSAIREGLYKPGDRLREEEIAARFGMSRTPVREGLGRLQEKGLVEAASGRGLAVAALNMQQVLELYAMREEAEGAAARFAARQITAVEIENIERLNEEFLAAGGDAPAAARLNRLFHARLYDAARNRYLRHALDDLQDSIALLAETTFVEPGRTEIAYEEHKAIIDALRSRSADDAYRAAAEHIRAALRARLRMAN
jgi:DNA-binding GntR family transcriptional regulator